MSAPDPKDIRIVRLEALLSAARDSLATGLETHNELEPDWNKQDRELVADIDAALAPRCGPVPNSVEVSFIYGPGRYAFRVGDMPEEVMRLPNMQNPETLVEVFGETLEGAHLELNKLLRGKLILLRPAVVIAPISPPVARYKPNNVRKKDRPK